MMEPNISTFIYNFDVTCVSSIYEHLIHPKLDFSFKYFYQEDTFGFFIHFYVHFFLKGGNTLFLGTKTFNIAKENNPDAMQNRIVCL